MLYGILEKVSKTPNLDGLMKAPDRILVTDNPPPRLILIEEVELPSNSRLNLFL